MYKMNKNDHKLLRNAILIFVIAVVLLVVVVFVNKSITANVIKEKQQESELYNKYLVENCECLVKERIDCAEGYELEGTLCKNLEKGFVTNVLKKCSEYDCSGHIKIWNAEIEDWEDEIDG